jgi:5-methyltetrahydrofolate--homocysteine methyltransferase
MPQPAGWVTGYSTKNEAYRVNVGVRACLDYDLYGEGVPNSSAGDLAPNCLALYLGCHGVEMPGTVWCEPFITDPAAARFDYDPDNFYWNFTLRVTRAVLARTRGQFAQAFPDLIEGLDTLEAMRGGQTLLVDLLDRPEWVQACLRQITDRYFRYYDVLYDLIRDEVGGSVFWAWAPGRMAKFQCDFSAMISKDMFGEFMVPVLREMTERVSYCMYHWDGPGAIQHHDHLLSIPRLTMLQWTPGAGAEPTSHRRWWPLYHKTLDAGKKLFIWAEDAGKLRELKQEFGTQLKGFYIGIGAASAAEARELLRIAEC